MPKRRLPSGLILRGRTYYACFRAGGSVVKKKLSTDLKAATEILNALRARADKEDFGLIDNAYPLEEIRTAYEKAIAQTLRPRTVKRYRQTLANILPHMPHKASAVTSAIVVTYREGRLAGTIKAAGRPRGGPPGPRTINMEVGALSTMLEWASSKSVRLIGSNPLEDFPPLPVDTPLKERRDLSSEEVLAILEHSPAYLKPALRMFVSTAMRRDELVEMTFDRIDFAKGIATVRSGVDKTHQEREIPLDAELLTEIAKLRDERPENPKDFVFVNGAGKPFRNNLLREFYRVCKKAKIAGAHPRGSVDLHSLRGTVATLSMENGANPKAVQALLGHATLAMTMKRYAKATEKSKWEAVASLPYLKKVVPTAPPSNSETS